MVWSGDVTATWETLRRQIAEGLNFCATGMPYWTADIGAFFVADAPNVVGFDPFVDLVAFIVGQNPVSEIAS